MNKNILQVCANQFVYVPLFSWLIIQIIKIIYEYANTKRLNMKRIIGAGGIISSHTTVVMTLTAMVGKQYGFNSVNFAICLIFSFIVMYDAMGIRNEVGKHVILLNEINAKQNYNKSKKLNEVLGHTPIQVLTGAIIGVSVGLIF